MTLNEYENRAIAEAKRQAGRSYQARLNYYEGVKRQLNARGITTAEYERIARAVITALGI